MNIAMLLILKWSKFAAIAAVLSACCPSGCS